MRGANEQAPRCVHRHHDELQTIQGNWSGLEDVLDETPSTQVIFVRLS